MGHEGWVHLYLMCVDIGRGDSNLSTKLGIYLVNVARCIWRGL